MWSDSLLVRREWHPYSLKRSLDWNCCPPFCSWSLWCLYISLQPQMAPLNVRCHNDSQVALYWIRGKDKEWKPFVQNRVREIRHNVHPDLWKHCPGKNNPADLPSKGLNILELSVSQLWRAGPEWLSLDTPISSDIKSTAAKWMLAFCSRPPHLHNHWGIGQIEVSGHQNPSGGPALSVLGWSKASL